MSLDQKNVQKTYAGFETTTNLDGQIFYDLKLTPSDTTLSLTDLKAIIKEYNLTLEANADFLTHIYTSDRDHRIGIKGLIGGVHPLEFDNLLPQR